MSTPGLANTIQKRKSLTTHKFQSEMHQRCRSLRKNKINWDQVLFNYKNLSFKVSIT